MPATATNVLKAPPISEPVPLQREEGLGRGFLATEFNIYGSSHIGMLTQPEELDESPSDPVAFSQTLGLKVYEFSNHLGNVLTTFSDRKIPTESLSDPGFVAYYSAEILSSTDYYPFGFEMPGRVYEADGYRYGFNSMEKDDKMKGSGNSYDFGARIYDPRVGRWLAVDPLARKYSTVSTYCFIANTPLLLIDPDGRKVKAVSKEAQEAIALTLTPDEAKYLKFKRNGMVNKRLLKQGQRKLNTTGENYKSLLFLVKEKDIYEVILSDKMSGITEMNNEKSVVSIDFTGSYVNELDEYWNVFMKSAYEAKGKSKDDYVEDYKDKLSSNRFRGVYGIVFVKNETTEFVNGKGEKILAFASQSTSNHSAFINMACNSEDRAKSVAHELYGHLLFYAKGIKEYTHFAGVEINSILDNWIFDRENEAKKNAKLRKQN